MYSVQNASRAVYFSDDGTLPKCNEADAMSATQAGSSADNTPNVQHP